jgi:hypothetical protein
MTKEELLADANSNHTLLETARCIGDYDSAQAICEHLTTIYRRLELRRLAEDLKGVVHDGGN